MCMNAMALLVLCFSGRDSCGNHWLLLLSQTTNEKREWKASRSSMSEWTCRAAAWEHACLCAPIASCLMWVHSAGGRGQAHPTGNPRKGGLGLLCAKPQKCAGKYDFFKKFGVSNYSGSMPQNQQTYRYIFSRSQVALTQYLSGSS